MKTCLITLPLLFAVNVALADDMSPEPAKAQGNAAMVQEKAQATPTTRHRARHLPRGDLRKCLDLKDNDAIIRCAETGRKK
jgi:hypothetical protein